MRVLIAAGFAGLMVMLHAPALAADGVPVTSAQEVRVADELAQAEQLYLSRADDAKLAALIERLASYEIFEAPRVYETDFFRSYLEYRKGDIEAAVTLLSQFKCMLDVEIGERKCSALAAKGADKVCADTMCAEMYLGYYERPTPEMVERVRRYQGYAADLEMKLGRRVAACGK